MAQIRLRNISNEYATSLQMNLREVAYSDATRREINQMIADMIRPYVPEFNGEFPARNEDYDGPSLRDSVRVGPTEISWNTPYAHYMWMDNLYEYNIPIHAKGDPKTIIGFYSTETKFPTGENFNYSTPKTGPRWWDLMLSDSQNRRTMNIRITNMLKRAIKNRRH